MRVCLSPLPGGGIQSYSQLMWPKQTPVQTGGRPALRGHGSLPQHLLARADFIVGP